MAHKRFLVGTTITFVLLVALGVAFNVLVDPYGLFEVWRKDGFNEIKPMAGPRVRVTKPYQLARAAPITLVAGNSRPEKGIDPVSRCWSSDDAPIFNAGVPGVGVYEQARLIQTAIEGGTVRRLFWGLDFLDFVGIRHQRTSRWPELSAEIDKRLPILPDGKNNSDYSWQSILDKRDAALSLDALFDSILTLTRQRDTYSATRRADGFNPGRDYAEIVKHEGQGVLFRQKNAEVVKRLSVRGLTLYPSGENWSRDFESVRFVLQLADQAGVETTLFINPYHADYLTGIDLTGNWPLFEKWKRRLTKLVGTSKAATLWDFNGFDEYSSPPPPDDAERGAALEWYWEPAHYRKELGDLMIAQMRGTRCEGADPKFGVVLNPTNVEAHLFRLRAQRDSHVENFEGRIAMLRGLADKNSN